MDESRMILGIENRTENWKNREEVCSTVRERQGLPGFCEQTLFHPKHCFIISLMIYFIKDMIS